jgi:hypothetical protein
MLDHVFFKRGFVLEGGGTLQTGQRDQHELKEKKVNFYPNEMIDHVFFQRGFVLEEVGHCEQVNI